MISRTCGAMARNSMDALGYNTVKNNNGLARSVFWMLVATAIATDSSLREDSGGTGELINRWIYV